MIPLDQIELATFTDLEDPTFRITEADITLTLVAARKTGEPYPGMTRVPFALSFMGAPGLRLDQRIHRLEHSSLGVLEIFLTQNSLNATGSEFEAIFS